MGGEGSVGGQENLHSNYQTRRCTLKGGGNVYIYIYIYIYILYIYYDGKYTPLTTAKA